jgi:3-phenylpropionate/cinnamic acid dioxygenase small subunit
MANERSDREQISDVLVRYATGIDTRNWPLFRTCFTPDVRADYGQIGVWNDVEGITEFMRTAHKDMSATKHMMSNFLVDVNGDEARVMSYVHAVLVVTDEPLTWVDAVGHYEDVFVRTAQGWRIADRKWHLTRFLTSDQARV